MTRAFDFEYNDGKLLFSTGAKNMSTTSESWNRNLQKSVFPASPAVIGFIYSAISLRFAGLLCSALVGLSVLLMFFAVALLSFPAGRGRSAPWKASLALLFASGVLALGLFGAAFWLWVVMLGLSIGLFVEPIRLARVPVLSTVLVFALILATYSAGAGAAHVVSTNALLLGTYFALLFCAARLVHEVAELNFDNALHRSSNAVAFGVERTFRFSFVVFSFAFGFLLLLTLGGLIRYAFALPFLIAFLVQGLLFLRTRPDDQSVLVYQFGVRVLYGLAAVVSVALRLALSIS